MRPLALALLCACAAPAAQPASHAVLVELGGSGGFLSVNYEVAFGPLALRAGGGYMLFTGPALNATAALRFGGVEVGGGVLAAPFAPTSPSENTPVEAAVVATGLAAYRWDMGDSGRFVRLALTPILTGDGEVVPWGGVAVGARLGE